MLVSAHQIRSLSFDEDGIIRVSRLVGCGNYKNWEELKSDRSVTGFTIAVGEVTRDKDGEPIDFVTDGDA